MKTQNTAVAMRVVALVVSAALALAGCVSYSPADQTASAEGIELKPGDKIMVVTADLRRETFEITEITEEVVKGESVEIALEDIRIVRIKQLDTGRTAVAGLAGVGLILAIGLLAIGSGGIAMFPPPL